MNSILKKKVKKMNAKLHTSNKPKYVSKADRAKLEKTEEQEEKISQESESQA